MATERDLVATLIAKFGVDEATAFLVLSGRTQDAAKREIDACAKYVEEAGLKATYAAFNLDIGKHAADFLSAYVDADKLPKTIREFEITVAYTPIELTIKDGQIVQPGGYLLKTRIKLEGTDDDAWKTINSIGRQNRAGGGTGGGRNVLTPKDAPFTSWRVHAETAYTVVESKPDYTAGELKIGSGYSAPDQLTKVNDCVYLYCKQRKDADGAQATWDEVLENCPDAGNVTYATD